MTNTKTQTRQRRSKEETARLGKEIYERDIKHLVKDDHDGEFVSIELDSRTWTIGDDLMTAADRLWEKCPDAVDVWTLRVGYIAVDSIGGGPAPRSK